MIKIYNKKLEYLVLHDPLTKLPNRRSFNTSFQNALLLYNRNKNSKALLFFDVDIEVNVCTSMILTSVLITLN